MAEEKRFENKIKAFLKEKGAWYVKYWGGGMYTRSGIPDLLVCYKGHFIAIEVKASKGKPSDLQKFEISQIINAGGFAFVLYPNEFNDFKAFIDSL